MPIDPEEVRHVARLARLVLDEDEVTRMSRDLGVILDHMAVLAEVPVDDVEAPVHASPLPTRLRPDIPEPSLDRDALLAGAPRVEDGMFRVPRIL
ncbi:MAG: Asp-tRNA(Asn)/Glu-tRNA(Gln) amidotransferase subunit GatC [Candidatus Sericytochromatia bacterium]|nr:Asp-tRNA(Asn)/Glu-tRNA(Gln) amidotransferase subunit GatC [Candidatus Tanganyikabacteria bacterium]MEB3203133.1 Asp-tRNA(Asn)/Glu-tRNA(Gln) amidotransferase subunit GatC [Candidatus Sericytochromatia bacterium]